MRRLRFALPAFATTAAASAALAFSAAPAAATASTPAPPTAASTPAASAAASAMSAAAASAPATSTASAAAHRAPAPAVCAGANLAPNRFDAAQIRRATLCLLNRERARRGLRRLRAQRSLGHAASNYAQLMVAKHFFDHVSPAGSTMASRIQRTTYLHHTRSWSLGENLAWGSGSASTPAQIVNAWMHSPPHRRNILDRSFREIGIGVALGSPTGTSGATYVNDFGRRA